MKTWRESFDAYSDRVCFAGGANDELLTYRQLLGRMESITAALQQAGAEAGSVVAFPGQYSPDNVATLLALADIKAVAVPLPGDEEDRIAKLLEIAQATHRVVPSGSQAPIGEPAVDTVEAAAVDNSPLPARSSPLYQQLLKTGHAGLVLFTSGTTGDPKGAVQDLDRLRLRYTLPRQVGKMLAFMHIDHIGGTNTLLYVLTHGGTLVVPRSRSPHDVAAAIEKHRIEVLPVSPTFLNLMLLSGVLESADLSSLKRITYGSEPMPQSVLDRLSRSLPGVEFLQTYGTTEVGILKSKSENNGSLWMKVGGEGYETKIVDGRLWIRAQTGMLGYLNAPSPFDQDGFMDTGDEVEVRGEWLRVLGRKSEFINVGGTKVSPVEVESVLLEMPSVGEAAVSGQPHPLMGQIVSARVSLQEEMPLTEFKRQMRAHCRTRLPAEAIPAKVTVTTEALVTDRFKRSRENTICKQQPAIRE